MVEEHHRERVEEANAAEVRGEAHKGKRKGFDGIRHEIIDVMNGDIQGNQRDGLL